MTKAKLWLESESIDLGSMGFVIRALVEDDVVIVIDDANYLVSTSFQGQMACRDDFVIFGIESFIMEIGV
jgi:hypothetical protein